MVELRRGVRTTALLSCGIAGLMTPFAFAADEPTQPQAQDDLQLEEVVVQSRRVKESQQNVPIAIQSFTMEQMERAGVRTLGDLVLVVPSMTADQVGPSKQRAIFSIRGQKADDVLQSQDQATAVYVGEIIQDFAYGVGIMGALDVASVEVAKGPQGTLFGRNTTGGAVIITPNAPSLTGFDASFGAGLGYKNRQTATAVANVPLSDTVAVRAAYSFSKRDGLVDNRGLDPGDDFSDENNQTWRLSLLWEPNDTFSTLTTYDGFSSSTRGSGSGRWTAVNTAQGADQGLFGQLNAIDPTFPNIGPGALSAVVADQETHPFYSAFTPATGYVANYPGPKSSVDLWGIGNISTVRLNDYLTVKNIIGFRHAEPLDSYVFDNSTLTLLSAVLAADLDQFSEELQLIGSGEKLNWIAGAFAFKKDGSDEGASLQARTTYSVGGPSYFKNESKAVYLQGTYALNDRLNLTLGLRQTWDERTVEVRGRWLDPLPVLAADHCLVFPTASAAAAGAPSLEALGQECALTQEAKFDALTYTASLDYHLAERQLIYATHRKGYRSGGIAGRATNPDELLPFSPEFVKDYEIGYKGDLTLFGSPLRFNIAGYYQDYTDVQRQDVRVVGAVLLNLVTNAAAAEIYGTEIDVRWLPSRDVELGMFYALTDASYTEWLTGAGIDRSSSKFPDVAKHAGNVFARYRLPIGGEGSVNNIWVQANARYQGPTALYVDNEVDASGNRCEGTSQGGYSLFGARVDWEEVAGRNLSVSAWGKNLGNREYYQGGLCLYNTAFGATWAWPGEPRTWGVDFTYRFGK